MAHSTITVRELRNKDTGIDLNVSSFNEISKMIGTSFEYQVMTVSNLSFFKSPKHKDSDNVQFTVQKTFNDFENLHSQLREKYPATVLPPLSKKAFIVNQSVAKERRKNLDTFVKFIASTPKLCQSPVLLDFLGVNAIKAGKFRKEKTEDQKREHEEPSQPVQDLFDDEDDIPTGDVFSASDSQIPEDSEPISIKDTHRTSKSKDEGNAVNIFDDQDYGGGITQDDNTDLFLVEGAVDSSDRKPHFVSDFEEDNQILQITDDLDNIIPAKDSTKSKPSKPPKPTKPAKPEKAPKPNGSKQHDVEPKPLASDNLSSGDILDYITQNKSDEADVDLFS